MKEEKNTTKPARAKDLASLLRNPLVIFGLILLAGDGPLVIAYALTSDPNRAWVFLGAIVAFIFGMGAIFCYLVVCKPRHLYAPTEIPETAFGKSIYHDLVPAATQETLLELTKEKQKPKPLSADVLRPIVNNLHEALCWYLLKVANQPIGIDEHLKILAKEIGLDDKKLPFDTESSAFGYLMCLANFLGLLLESADYGEGLILTMAVSENVISLISQRLQLAATSPH